jgi:membrane fusion protein (multidrug efflux system)
MTRKRRHGAVLLTLGFAACGLACGGSGNRPEAAAANPQASAPAATPAEKPATQAAREAPAAQQILSVLTVEHEVDVLAERGGLVETILTDDGTRVRKGEQLAQLDDRTLQAQLAHDRDDLLVAQNNVKYNQAELKAKQANYKRYRELRQLGLSSQADLEKAKFEAEGAQYDLKSWQAIVKRTGSQIRIAELALDKMKIRAPFDGVIARRYIRQGQEVGKGDRCFRITQLRPLEVRFPVPETSRHTPRAGDRIQVSLASDAGRVFPARIIRVGPVIDPASGSWNVLAELVGRLPRDLRPGMAVQVRWPPAPGSRRR